MSSRQPRRSPRNWPLWAGAVLVACSIPERVVEERAVGEDRAGSSFDDTGGGGALSGAHAGGGGFNQAGSGIGGGGVFVPSPAAGMASAAAPPVPSPGGAASVAGCTVPPITPTCDQAGAPATDIDWCDTTGIAGNPQPLVDDFEDRDAVTGKVLDGRGAWFVANDGTGQQYPGPCVLPSVVPEHRPGDSSSYGMHTFGIGFQTLPDGFATLGVGLRTGPGPNRCEGPLDASGYTGVEFWVLGSGHVRFVVATVATTPTSNFGSCQSGCYDSHGALVSLTPEWSLVRLPFSVLTQEGWGTPVPFDASQILTLQWSPKAQGAAPGSWTPASCFDFWIDDVSFY